MRYVQQRAREEGGAAGLVYEVAHVTRVVSLGMGDRACVDLACLLHPGEGLLVGSFARCLALVHSECEESSYIASRWGWAGRSARQGAGCRPRCTGAVCEREGWLLGRLLGRRRRSCIQRDEGMCR